MLTHLLRRLLWMVPTTIGIVAVVFVLFHAVPGDPAVVALGVEGEGEAVGFAEDREARLQQFRRKHGLDRPLWVQFFNALGPFNLLRDGHPWFRSPCPERVVLKHVLEPGREILEADPVPLEFLSETAPDERAAIQVAVADLLKEDPVGWESARECLQEFGAASLPALLNALVDLSDASQAAFQRVEEKLVALRGAALDVPEERLRALGHVANVRAWHAWYYADLGASVRNSGARPWAGLLALDFGRERLSGLEVGPEIARRLRVTLPLALAAILLSFGLAIPLGLLSALAPSPVLRTALTALLYGLYAIPSFWGGLLLISLFGATGPDWWFLPKLPVLSLHGSFPEGLSGWERMREVILRSILPVIALSYVSIAYLVRQVRASTLEALQEEYVRALRARGLRERAVLVKHVLRNALLPVVTLFGSVLPALVGGSVIVETVFDLPGMGKYAYQGLLRRDLAVVLSTTVLMGVVTQLGLLLTDLCYGRLDPRLRHG